MTQYKTISHYIFIILISIFQLSCKKMVEIPPSVSTITTPQAFATDEQANATVAGIYFRMLSAGSLNFANGALSVYCGMSADDLIPLNQNASNPVAQFRNNNLLSNNGNISASLWAAPYNYINSVNAILTGLQLSGGIDDSTKRELTGEVKFLRAFCYFYLTNLFGDVPLPLTSSWDKNNLLARISSAQVYQQIINDLKDAQSLLLEDYSVSGGLRTRANKWAATALLARTYLYIKDWNNAEIETTKLISNSLFTLAGRPDSVFLTDSPEAIWQLQQNNTMFPFNSTQEGYTLVPSTHTSNVFAFLTPQLLNAFETGDTRKIYWIDSSKVTLGGVKNTLYYPYKYTDGPAQAKVNNLITQYYIVLRLTEQYLIRAEARAQKGTDLDGAAGDINIIRGRAGLPPVADSSQPGLLNEIYHERQVEFFAEWGNRWLDLKRTGLALSILSANKPLPINNDALLYPIPQIEIKTDPNLTQNHGYN